MGDHSGYPTRLDSAKCALSQLINKPGTRNSCVVLSTLDREENKAHSTLKVDQSRMEEECGGGVIEGLRTEIGKRGSEMERRRDGKSGTHKTKIVLLLGVIFVANAKSGGKELGQCSGKHRQQTAHMLLRVVLCRNGNMYYMIREILLNFLVIRHKTSSDHTAAAISRKLGNM